MFYSLYKMYFQNFDRNEVEQIEMSCENKFKNYSKYRNCNYYIVLLCHLNTHSGEAD